MQPRQSKHGSAAYITLAIEWVNPYKFVSLCGDCDSVGSPDGWCRLVALQVRP